MYYFMNNSNVFHYCFMFAFSAVLGLIKRLKGAF